MPRKQPISDPELGLRDQREPGWFWIQNELLDVFSPHIGEHAVLVYVILARHCTGNSSQVRISLRQITGETIVPNRPAEPGQRLSRTTVMRALLLLECAGLILQLSSATRTEPPLYGLPSLVKAASSFSSERREAVAVLREHSRARHQGPSVSSAGLRVVSIAQGGSEGTTYQEASEPSPSLRKKPRKSSGNAVENCHISTFTPGPPVVPTGPEVVPGGDTGGVPRDLSIEENRKTGKTKENSARVPEGMTVSRPFAQAPSEDFHG